MVGPSSKVYKGIREIGLNEEDVEDRARRGRCVAEAKAPTGVQIYMAVDLSK